MKGIITTIFLATVVCGIQCVSAHCWDVEWYEIDPLTHGFGRLVGSETWPAGNFYHNWGKDYLYDRLDDDVGFVALTTITSTGGNYTFELYQINDEACVSIDGEQILISKGWGIKEVYIPEGVHTLKVTYKETCCAASIGFRTNETLFSVNDSGNIFLLSPFFWESVVGIAVIGFIAAILLFKKRK